MTTIPVHTDDADLSDPRTAFAAWSPGGIICNDDCPRTREHAIAEAEEFLRLNPDAADVHVYAWTPVEF